ncbi:MAG: two-component system response regulator [Stygiobacter sp. RIFOXYC12_FULL_38_8]|nr:MAG: two-component system response regulator [Stygiobacter sp. GWC2_38_9]OGU86059.1 MAG: two-component system response regulator [Stygiobacter sp. RIFOXYA12_FULL_38_9]OGV07397.1 MAG: two-component system response regulator [Stygiobacter sp. RIFOXYB2_FULL_37_11]OGV14700.1 MAG: two-component system response regulator [Stygiobacter sp. RIFOXYC2_FULL_38_25]OGV18248.1 MAG: two-component system response regulator [Stygiobacter sp. RIFOXYA2_FULL_38_8]OGV25147.1 MAG: two-component system response r
MRKFSVIIIDDEEAQVQSLKSFLTKRSYTVFTANEGEEALKIAQENTIDIVLTDFQMPGWDGLTVLREMKNLNPEIDVVVLTAFGTIESAVQIMKAGAFDYLIKPIDLDELETILNRIKERKHLLSENKTLKEQLQDKFRFESMISQSSVMENVLSTAGRVASSKATVLIRGESGTGKELIAKAIHFASPRKEKPFVTVNVASLSESLLESELFGHEKGSYTGAISQRIGRFEEANGGTIFIDEVGDIPLTIQVKLLRTIQFGEYQRIGSNQTEKTDVRIIAATHRNLEEMMQSGLFREDLFYRLNVVAIQLPALRQRKDDIPILVDHFIKRYSHELGKEINGISREALDQLFKYSFPGNIRELENVIQRAVVLSRENMVTTNDLPQLTEMKDSEKKFDPFNLDDNYETKMKEFELAMINEALKRTNGNKSAAARILGISERHLRSRLERL